MDEKKEKEKIILKKIYNEKNKNKYRLVDDTAEKPDFTMEDLKNGDIFGVEVTNMYYDEFSARLKEIPNYIGEMLKNGIPRKATGILNKHQLYIEIDKSWHYIGDTIGESFKKYDDYIDALVNTINTKSIKAKKYNNKLKYIELFINDKENYLTFKNIKHLAYLEKSEKLWQVINKSPFKRIYFFTIVDRKEMLLLIGDTKTGPLSITAEEMNKHQKYMKELLKEDA